MALSQFDPAYDFNNDQQLTLADRDAYLASHGSMLGDANFDGVIDSQDLDIVMRNMNRQGTGWAQGDFNASGSTTGYDLYLWISARSAVAGQAITGDLNYDNVIDVHDIDLLYVGLNIINDAGSSSYEVSLRPLYDLNSDGLANEEDMDYLIEVILDTAYGDANLDGYVNFWDFVSVNNNYNSFVFSWGMGDFNGDGIVDQLDYAIMMENWQFGV
jgi:hypothetical protein